MEFIIERPARKYESVVILHPDLTEDQQKSFFQKNKELLKTFGGDIHKIDSWGKRKLGNPIEKLKMGTYFYTTFEAKSEAILELERTFRINDKVLRFTHRRLDDRISIEKHFDEYREVIEGSKKREQERESKIQAKKMAAKDRKPARG